MARRELQEINAGSMADIAFLLLIFFLVTTTMEVDAGIGRTLPLKRDIDIPIDIEIRKRDVLEIMANNNDELLVEEKPIEISELEEIVRDFYTANSDGVDRVKDMPTYSRVDIPTCKQKIADLQQKLEENPEEIIYKNDLQKWKTKLELCEELPTKSYNELYKMAVIRLQNQSKTSYGLYIEIQDILKKVVNDLRAEKCEEIWGRDYFSLNEDLKEDKQIQDMLEVLVPERIVEAPIQI